MEKPKCKILYLSLYYLLKKKYLFSNCITKKEIHCDIGKHFLIPKRLKQHAINELQIMKIIKKEDKNRLVFTLNDSYESELKRFNL